MSIFAPCDRIGPNHAWIMHSPANFLLKHLSVYDNNENKNNNNNNNNNNNKNNNNNNNDNNNDNYYCYSFVLVGEKNIA